MIPQQNQPAACNWIPTAVPIQKTPTQLDRPGGTPLFVGVELEVANVTKISTYIYLQPKWPLFWLEKALFWGVDLQK